MTRIWNGGTWERVGHLPLATGDRGLLHGCGLFETMLAVDGEVPLWPRHRMRLVNSMARLGWGREIPFLPDDFGRGRMRVRLTLTGGSGSLAEPAAEDGLWILSAAPAGEIPAGWTVGISPWRRNEHSPLAGLKTTSYAENLAALAQARAAGLDDVIWLNTSGAVCEASTANVFLLKSGVLITPSLESGCLPGIGRAVAIETAHAEGRPVEERRVDPRELEEADSLFLTNAVHGRFSCQLVRPSR